MTAEVPSTGYVRKLNIVGGKIDNLEPLLRAVAERPTETTDGLARLEVKLEQRFKDLGHQLMGLDVDVKKLTQSVDAVGHKAEMLDQRIDAVDTRIDAVDIRIDVLGLKLDVLDTKLTMRIDVLDTKIDALSTEISRIVTHLGVGGSPPPAGHL